MTLKILNVIVNVWKRFVFVFNNSFPIPHKMLIVNYGLVIVATPMTCQQFQHSPNLFGDCGAYGVHMLLNHQ